MAVLSLKMLDHQQSLQNLKEQFQDARKQADWDKARMYRELAEGRQYAKENAGQSVYISDSRLSLANKMLFESQIALTEEKRRSDKLIARIALLESELRLANGARWLAICGEEE